MAMTGGMALAPGDPFREDKETSSAYWTKQDAGSSDFFDEYVILDDDDSLGPGGHASSRYYEDLAFAPADSLMSPPTSIDTSQLVCSGDGSLQEDHTRDHLQPHPALSYQHQSTHTPGPQRLTQQILDEQSGFGSNPGSSSVQRRLNTAVSDTELQRLEDLSMTSPRRGTAPPQSHSHPVSPRSSQQPSGPAQSPKKLGRMEMIYASIRKATTIRRKMSSAPIGADRDEETVSRGRSSTKQYTQQAPMTPPPTGRMLPATPSQHDPLGITFVDGQYDDPFQGTLVDQHGHVVGYPPQHTLPNNGMMLSLNNNQAPPNWPLTDGYASSSGNSDEMVWAGGNDYQQQQPHQHQQQQHHHNPPQTPAAQQAWYPATPGNPMKTVSRQPSSEFGTQNAMNATLNLALHLQHGGGGGQQQQQQQQPIYHHQQQQHQPHQHYGHTHHHSESGLPIHMPQPRQHAAALPILSPPHPQRSHYSHHGHSLSLDGSGLIPSYLAPPTHQPTYRLNGGGGEPPSTPQHNRRPKPRAPSSGARHTSLSLTSPRKPPPIPSHHLPSSHQPRGRSTSSSPSKSAIDRGARRVTSASDLHSSPSKSDGLPSAGVLNSSIRKRRSRSKSMSRTSQPNLRTPSHSSLSSAAEGGSPSKAGGVGNIGFVNYTPDDSRVLMTGVAPSGSSKTKARREREAAERQRRLSEAVMKAVAAAGGDVGRLREEGVLIDEGDHMVY
ncbi:hypothetical protein GE09DRAFT_140240 [Coniochaeta sp. 2T2.1]|nr:hypothetical protein GE09DRAFT_140240 [Coniochaeta sp. 2T2.1]